MENDCYYVNNIKNGIDVDASINALTEKHIALISQNFSRYGGGTGVSTTEMIKDAALVVYRAAETFDPSRATQYSSWLSSQSRFHVLNLSKPAAKFYNQINTEPAELEFIPNPAQDDERINAKKKELLDYIMFLADSHSNPQIKLIISLRYFGDKKERSYQHIGGIVNLTGQAVKNLHSQFLKLVKEKMRSKEMLDFI